ncbi:MAG: M28 family peptidase [Planctomycetota bacterium]
MKRARRAATHGGFALAVAIASTACSTALQPVSAGALEQHVRFLAAMDPPRSSTDPDALERAASYVEAQLAAAGVEVASQAFVVDGASYRNVRATLGPATDEWVVVGAHYDVADQGPGADDNASGVAVLIALAHLLRDAELPRRVELVAYALEEPPHFGTANMGSAHHAAWLTANDVRVRGMLCLEMVGYYTAEPDSQDYPLASLRARYPTTGDFLAIVGRGRDKDLVDEVHDAMAAAVDLPLQSLAALLPMDGIDWSDHRNYWAAGFPAVMLTDTAFFRNPHYHRVTDAPGTLDYRRMRQVALGVAAAVESLCRS